MSRWFSLKMSGLAVAATLILGSAAACGTAKSPAATDRGQAGTSIAAPTQAAAPALAEAKVASAAPGNAGAQPSATGGGAQPPATAGGAAQSNQVAPGLDRKIVRTASLGLVVDDPDAAVGAIGGIVTGLGGYVAQSSLSRTDNKLRGTITVRVPVEAFDQTMGQIKRLGVRVERENVSGQDVTQEYADTQARVRNLEATEEQLRLLLSTVREKTNRTEDILTVYRELTNIQGQIEQAKGRIQYLDKLSALATLTIEVLPKEAPTAARPGWSPITTLREAAAALGQTAQLVLDVAIWLMVVILPVTLAVVAPIAVVYVAGRRWLGMLGSRRSHPAG